MWWILCLQCLRFIQPACYCIKCKRILLAGFQSLQKVNTISQEWGVGIRGSVLNHVPCKVLNCDFSDWTVQTLEVHFSPFSSLALRTIQSEQSVYVLRYKSPLWTWSKFHHVLFHFVECLLKKNKQTTVGMWRSFCPLEKVCEYILTRLQGLHVFLRDQRLTRAQCFLG